MCARWGGEDLSLGGQRRTQPKAGAVGRADCGGPEGVWTGSLEEQGVV